MKIDWFRTLVTVVWVAYWFFVGWIACASVYHVGLGK